MIVRSPLKEKKTRPNLRKIPAGENTRNPGDHRNTPPNGNNHGRYINEKEERKRLSFPKIKPWKVILGAFVIGVLGVLYLNHVFATQELLHEVQQLEREYNQARRMNAEYRLTYDRMIGPAEIYEKAKELGLINGGPAEKIIEVEKE